MATAKKTTGNTLADLRSLHDRSVLVPNRIRSALALMNGSGNEWMYEADFMKLTQPGISPPDLRDYREEFKDFWADMPPTNGKRDARRVWFATKKLADAWKER